MKRIRTVLLFVVLFALSMVAVSAQDTTPSGPLGPGRPLSPSPLTCGATSSVVSYWGEIVQLDLPEEVTDWSAVSTVAEFVEQRDQMEFQVYDAPRCTNDGVIWWPVRGFLITAAGTKEFRGEGWIAQTYPVVSGRFGHSPSAGKFMYQEVTYQVPVLLPLPGRG